MGRASSPHWAPARVGTAEGLSTQQWPEARAAAGSLGLEVSTGPVIQKATVGFCSHLERYSPSLQGAKADAVNTLGFIFDLVGHQSSLSPQVELPGEG